MSPAFKAVIITGIVMFLILITVSILQVRMNLMSKRVFLYVLFPLLLFPLPIALTYVVWPEPALHLAARLLIAVVSEGIVLANFYFFSVPFYKATIPEFKEYFYEEDDENRK